jgi:hypothetical protein
MSATLGTTFDWRKLLDNPLPVYQDTGKGNGDAAGAVDAYQQLSPWQQALATTKQDTGWTKLADPFPMAYDPMTRPGLGTTHYPVPGTYDPGGPAESSGTFGYDYSGAAPGYNAWALYNGGTQDGGWYNAAADTQQWDSGRGNGSQSNTRDTIWRWTLDDLKAQGLDPGKAPVDVVNRAFLKNVARMHRDFDANKLNWQQSGFANFDRVLPGGGIGGQRLPGSALPNGGMSVDYTAEALPGGTQGGGTVAGYTQYPGQEGGAGGARPGQALPSGTSSPNGGTSHPGVPGLGTMGGDPLYNYGLALNGKPEDRARLIGEASGRTSPAHGRLAEFATNLYANALKAYLMISQLGGGGAGANPQTGVGDMNSFLAAMGGQGMIPLLQAGIGKGLGGDLGQDPETQEQAYRAALALRSMFSGGLASDVAGQHLDDAMWQQGASVDRNPLGGGQSLVDILKGTGSQYGSALNQYLGLR